MKKYWVRIQSALNFYGLTEKNVEFTFCKIGNKWHCHCNRYARIDVGNTFDEDELQNVT